MENDFRSIPLSQLVESTTNPRRHFDEEGLDQLAESIKAQGILQPILVRPAPPAARVPEAFEVVAGARRFRAAQRAGLAEAPCIVRELTDDQALEIQVVENLQRADVHELDEAIGYEALTARGYTVDQIAEKVGRDRSYIYKRMKLCSLGEKGREAFFDGKLEMSVALLLSRIPTEKLQEKALGQLVAGDFTFKQASDHLQRNYMLLLEQAPFPVADAELLKGVPACGACPKNTGNQGDLFGDVPKGALCTDPPCFAKKRDAQWKRESEAAAAEGRKILSAKESKGLYPHPHNPTYTGNPAMVDLKAQCWDDPKRRTYEQLLGDRGHQAASLTRDERGATHEVLRDAEAKKLLREAGHKFAQPRKGRAASVLKSAAAQKPDPAEKLRAKVDALLIARIVAAAEKGSVIDALRILVHYLTWNEPAGSVVDVADRRGLKRGDLERLVAKADQKTLQGLAVELAVAYAVFDGLELQDDNLRRAAAAYKLDVKKLRAELEKERATVPVETSPATGSSAKRQNAAVTAKKKPAKKPKPKGPLARKAGKAKKAA